MHECRQVCGTHGRVTLEQCRSNCRDERLMPVLAMDGLYIKNAGAIFVTYVGRAFYYEKRPCIERAGLSE